ncbi:MAG TPA: reverse transcriptase-like protein [Solirubrobacterales bacterium]|nr:reverse transcriptase-like protein [Solirubrobacterales bacterium]
MSRLIVNFDGGSRGNPGPAAIGVVVRDSGGKVLEEVGERIGEATNNVAEYKALLRGIELAAARGASELELVGDSALVVRQVEGRYKVKNAGIKPLHEEAKRALRGFDSWSIRHVPRAQNADADRLVNEAFDGKSSDNAPSSQPQPEEGPGSIDPGVDIGHVHLKVADVDRALDFYCGILGFELMQRWGADAAFVSAGGYHHHIGLNSWSSKGGSPPPAGTTGLFHTAIRYPTRRALADALRRLSEAGWPLEGASDHGVSEALYLADPDHNGVELYWDRPRDQWPRPPQGEGVEMGTFPLDLDDLISELKD